MANLTGMFGQLNQALSDYGTSLVGTPSKLPLEQQNAMQRAGINNPLLQRLGMGLGGMMGKDLRSEQQQLESAYTGLDPSDPQSLLAVAQVVEKYDPVKAAELRGKAAQVVTTRTTTAAETETRNLQNKKIQAEIDKLNAEALAEGKTEGEWKAVGGDSGYIYNSKTGDKKWASYGEDPAKGGAGVRPPRKDDLTLEEKTNLKKVVDTKYKHAPQEYKDAMYAAIDSNTAKNVDSLTKILSDDDLAKVVTPERKQRMITDAQAELSKVLNFKKYLEDAPWLSTGQGSWVARSIFGAEGAVNAEAYINSIQASQAFETLKDIKASGATLGQVSNIELQLLISEVEALNQGMGDAALGQALNNIEQRYRNFLASMNGEMTTIETGLEGEKAYLSSTNRVSIADDKGGYKEYGLSELLPAQKAKYDNKVGFPVVSAVKLDSNRILVKGQNGQLELIMTE